VRRVEPLLCVLIAVGSCSSTKSDSMVVVTVTASASLSGVTQLRATLSNAGSQDVEYFPAANAGASIELANSFGLSLPKSRNGDLLITIDALDAASQLVASGSGTVKISVGGRADVTIDLTPASAGVGDQDDGGAITSQDAAATATQDGGDSSDARSVDPPAPEAGSDLGGAETALPTGDREGDAAADAAPPAKDALVSGVDSSGNCLSGLIANGYACANAPPCSACKDSSTSKQVECQAVIKCMAASYPCTGNCLTLCYTRNGGSGPVQACVAALQAAACGATSCETAVGASMGSSVSQTQ